MDDKIKLVQHLADLAMLTFSEKELEGMVNDMQDIIGLIDLIKEADVSGIKPELNEIVFADLRKDEAKPSTPKEDLLKNAAKAESGSFEVTKVVE